VNIELRYISNLLIWYHVVMDVCCRTK